MLPGLVTIVVPVYNVKEYLNRCLKSIVLQTYKNIEIILIDDGSTDGSGEMCDQWKERDKRIKVIHKKKCWFRLCKKQWIGHCEWSIHHFCGF